MTNTSDPIRDLFEIKKSVLQKKLRMRCGAWLSTPRQGAKFQTSPNRYITKGGNSKAPGGTAHMAHTFFYCLWFLCWIITSINHCTEWKPAFYKGTLASQLSAIFFQSFLDMSSPLLFLPSEGCLRFSQPACLNSETVPASQFLGLKLSFCPLRDPIFLVNGVFFEEIFLILSVIFRNFE